ncbi:type II toxin-antitoxin system YafQ family toxin [Synergistes jonesii]|uniref:RelE/StbE family addiction module toxin n=1 Tax=Synergistes jonesii TaxID=2754 RepID=A0A073IMN9_9BACT|nr:type II toxin-antitoxin system YafQ family toxin [Synergistes jonesii]KEJ91603.1 hypothetical protein EH55_08395 [Synergistes jonesii]OFB60836.1 hypothetical protein JS73_10480 [Synergistes jonesii]OFB61749.1 hypothetical protein JS79_10630 [Synergistes jonesii]OFB63237.1 hypothetical protein JS72_07160 [Synergistes jonesii]OFB66842.1 hypothetical protein JS78_10505 [Synergistes jonesii]
MREIVYSSRYKRDLKRMIRRGANLALHDEALALLVADAPLPERYRDHALVGEWKGFRELHIRPDWLLVYAKEGDMLLLLAAAGSHADVFEL